MDNATRKLMGFPHTGEREQERRKRQHERDIANIKVGTRIVDETAKAALDTLPTQGKMLPMGEGWDC